MPGAILSAMKALSLFTLAAILALPMASMAAPSSEAITFAVDSKRTFLPLEEAANHLAWTPIIDDKRGKLILNGTTISTKSLRTFTDGTNLISLADLAKAGAEVTVVEDGSVTKVAIKGRYFNVVKSEKRAEINLAQQKLRAWEGQRLVLETRVSSGKRGRTPSGDYSAGPYKARKHYSSRYNNAYMPYSVPDTFSSTDTSQSRSTPLRTVACGSPTSPREIRPASSTSGSTRALPSRSCASSAMFS